MTPLLAPAIHKFVPLSLVTLRGLFALKAVVVVEVLILPLASTSPTSRSTADPPLVEVPAIEATPGAAAYPVSKRYCPFSESVSSPSDVAVPLAVSGLFDPLAAVGIGKV